MPSQNGLSWKSQGCTSPTCFAFAHDQAGVIENLFLIIMVYHLALTKVRCYTRRIYHWDQLHPKVFQAIPTSLIVIFFQHGGEREVAVGCFVLPLKRHTGNKQQKKKQTQSLGESVGGGVEIKHTVLNLIPWVLLPLMATSQISPVQPLSFSYCSSTGRKQAGKQKQETQHFCVQTSI